MIKRLIVEQKNTISLFVVQKRNATPLKKCLV